MPTYCLIDNGIEMPRWCELSSLQDGTLSWIDMKGRHTSYEHAKIIGHSHGRTISEAIEGLPDETVKLEQDGAYRFLLDPWSDQGWVSPDGKFFGCKFYQHDDIAYSLIRKSPGRLEHEGWVRVHSDSFRFEDHARGLTKRQERTLEKLGFTDLYHRKRVPQFKVDRNQPAPRYAVKPPAHIQHSIPEKAAEPAGGEDKVLHQFIDRMKSLEPVKGLFDHTHEVIPDVGPGTWVWMIQWDHLHIGSEEEADDLLKAEGLRLHRTSFDTIEIMSWHGQELEVGPRELNLIELQLNADFPQLSMTA